MWLLPLALCVHELEEWNIHPWELGFFENPPTSHRRAHIVLFLVSAAGLVWTAAACALPSTRATAVVSIVGFAFIMVGNGIQHLYWSFLSGSHAPGALASGLVCFPAMGVVTWHALRNRLIGRSLIAGLGFLWFAMLVGIIHMGRTMPGAIHALQGIGTRVGALLELGA